MYEFVQKLEKKKKMGFQPGTNMLAIVAAARNHHPTSSISAHFIYLSYNKKTIRKTRLYKFIICVA